MAPVLLVLRALKLGDLLVAVPALRGLRRRYPAHRILLAAPPALGPVAALTGAVDGLVAHRGLAPPPVSAPDVAVDLHGVLPASVQALQALRPRHLVAFASAAGGHLAGPEPEPGEHERERWCRLVRFDRAPCDPDDVLLPRPLVPSPRPSAVVVHPGAAYGSKRWPAWRFAAVARSLAAQGHDVVVTGTAQERELTATVTSAAGLPADHDFGGRTDLPGLLALVAGARLVVSGDTGVAHVASAFARPSVTLFGPASPRLWGPPDRPFHLALWHGSGEREVLTSDPDPALLSIGVDEVLTAAAAALSAQRQPAPSLPDAASGGERDAAPVRRVP